MKLWSRLKKNKIRSSIAYTIKPRKVKFEWLDSPIDWIPTNLLPAISSMKLI